jgi:hypothetical protein
LPGVDEGAKREDRMISRLIRLLFRRRKPALTAEQIAEGRRYALALKIRAIQMNRGWR